MWKVNDSPLGSNPADFSQGVNPGDSPPWGTPQGFSSFSSNLKLLLLVFKILACCKSPLPFPDSSLRSKMKVVQFQCCITVVRIVMIKWWSWAGVTHQKPHIWQISFPVDQGFLCVCFPLASAFSFPSPQINKSCILSYISCNNRYKILCWIRQFPFQ